MVDFLYSLKHKQVELNTKQACMHAFIVYNKIYIIIIITFDVSGVTILINIDLLIQQAFMICIQDYGKHIQNYD